MSNEKEDQALWRTACVRSDRYKRELESAARTLGKEIRENVAQHMSDGYIIGFIEGFRVSQGRTTLQEKNTEEASTILRLRKAVQANHQWHLTYDEYEGYPDSDLCDQNIAALKSTFPGELETLLKDFTKALEKMAEAIEFFEPSHVFQSGSKAAEVQDFLKEVYQLQRETFKKHLTTLEEWGIL